MIIYVLSSCWFFIILNQIITPINFDKTNWFKHNILLSFIHAAICSVLLLISFYRESKIFQDPLSHSNHFNYVVIAFSTGYFLYDLIDCIQNSTSSIIAYLIHHIIVMIFFIHVLFYTRNVGYAIYGLSIEINSVFLHSRRLVRWYSPLLSSIYLNNLLRTIVDIGNYITFILFRFGIVLVGLRALHIQRNRLNPVIHKFTVIIVSSMGILNIILFYRLVKSHIIRTFKLNEQKPVNNENSITNDHILIPS